MSSFRAARRVGSWVVNSWTGRACTAAIVWHQYDTHFKYARFNRNVRSIWAAVETLVDYKFLFARQRTAEELEALHERVAKRWYDVCCKNAGLYIKLGQQIATMNHILPPPYLKYFSELHDQAPSVSFEVVEGIFRREFKGKKPQDVFLEFEEMPIASASIAQVHRARLADGTPVAVKIQKPEIAVQLPWDLGCFHLLVFCFEKIFDLPMYWTVEPLCKAVRQEVDFHIEARNSEIAKDFFDQDKRFYIPSVCWDFTSERVLTMEWIDGIKISKLSTLRENGFDVAAVAHLMVEAFSRQIFLSGFVHADPHPGNMLVRRRPNSRETQLVILDHGSYLSESELFRKQYCELWKAMVLLDTATVDTICKSWGIKDSNFFASLQLLKPYNPEKHSVHLNATTMEDIVKLQVEAYERVKRLLSDSQQVPRELILLGRNLNIVRSNNKGMGSSVNRINMMAHYAAEGISVDLENPLEARLYKWYLDRIAHQPPELEILRAGDSRAGGMQTSRAVVSHRSFGRILDLNLLFFKSQLLLISVVYYTTQLWRKANEVLFGRKVGGFEDILEASVAATIEAKLGFKLNLDHGVDKCFG
mmetsp:Transcript_21358/g.48244  ORF Transcript_21358/g.48244 Transcript_21358/m.48244 type:complete len:589 (-) Transcript_21358:52-1818(-)